jgi:hypothetical protein
MPTGLSLCFMLICEQTEIISLYSIYWSYFITVTVRIDSVVKTETLKII